MNSKNSVFEGFTHGGLRHLTHSGLKLGSAVVGVLCLAFNLSLRAQVQTQTTTSTGQATHQVSVQRGEVLAVDGNDVLVRMQNGQIRHFPNVPSSVVFNVDGQQLHVQDLKPGMKLQRTVTTTTIPKTVTTVQSVEGTVFFVSPPSSVILRLNDGTNQKFNIPKGQKFNVNGQEVDAFGLRKGMKIQATRVVEVPTTTVQTQAEINGTAPPPPPAPPADTPILIAVVTPVPAPAQTAEAQAPPQSLPKTGSILPLLGLLGTLFMAASFGLTLLARRRFSA
jgi:hypothetical protein